MKTETIFYCEGPGCERHVRTTGKRPAAFFEVSTGAGLEPMYFCGWDCTMKYAATLPPEEIIPIGDVDA